MSAEELKTYNTKETAKIMRISVVTLNAMRKQGKIKASFLGGKYLYSEEDIKASLELCKNDEKRRTIK